MEQLQYNNKDEFLAGIQEALKNAAALKENIISDTTVEDSIKMAGGDKLLSKSEKMKKLQEKAAKKRKEVNLEKKESGIRRPKQSKFNTRSDSYLQPGLRALHIILHDEKGSPDIYKDGADFAHRMAVGVAHFGNTCKKNAYERLIDAQSKIKEKIGSRPLDYPNWIIISNSTSIIMDRDILTRLEVLRDTTHCAGAYGFEKINNKGRFFEPSRIEDTRGCYIQADLNSTKWNFVVGNGFRDSDRYKVVCIYGPFIAIRGSTFMSIDFTPMANTVKNGFQHYMAEISMECVARGYFCATISTIAQQFDKIHNYTEDAEFIYDQSKFKEKWAKYFPISINGIGT